MNIDIEDWTSLLMQTGLLYFFPVVVGAWGDDREGVVSPKTRTEEGNS